jgi:dihydroorotase
MFKQGSKKYELVLKNGILIDPSQRLYGRKDVAFDEGKIAAVENDISASEAKAMIDCSGLQVAPGFIDLHVHTFWGVSHYGIDHVDQHCLAKGATTVVDAGSAGADTYRGFKRYVIERSKTRIFGMINIARSGMLNSDMGESVVLESLNIDKAAEVVEENRDTIVGVKVRLTETHVNTQAGLLPLYRARDLADKVNLPIVVHPQNALCDSIDDILSVLKAGDIFTHCFHRDRCGILDDQRKILDSVWNSMKKGIIFDVGHGMGSFIWDIAESAFEHGFRPDVISSDLHMYNFNGPVFNLATTASKFLYLGMSLGDVIEKVTLSPAKAIRKQDKLGNLKVGSCGDAVVFKIKEGSFDLFDGTGRKIGGKWMLHNGTGEKRVGNQFIVPVMVIRNGQVYAIARTHAKGE